MVDDGRGGESVKDAEIIWVHSTGALSVETQEGTRLLNLSPSKVVRSQHHRSSLTDFEAVTLGINYFVEFSVYLLFLFISVVQLDGGWSLMRYTMGIPDVQMANLFRHGENGTATHSLASSDSPLLTDQLWLGSSLIFLCILVVSLLVACVVYFYKVYRSLERR